MRRQTILVVAVLGLALGGCDSFDPLDKFQEWDIMGSGKKPLQGERQPVFPQGVPGVQQGVPPDLVKGYQAPAEPPPQVVEEKKAKPKPKVAARPKPKAQPKQAQPQQQQQQQQQTAPAQATAPQPTAPWPEPPPPPQNSAAWPAIPGSQPTWPSQAPPPATR
jgi:outer membrane biosynthesis protein TonB